MQKSSDSIKVPDMPTPTQNEKTEENQTLRTKKNSETIILSSSYSFNNITPEISKLQKHLHNTQTSKQTSDAVNLLYSSIYTKSNSSKINQLNI